MQRRHDLSGETIVSTNVIPPFRFIVICVNTDVSAGRREGGGGVAACTVVNKKKKSGNRSDPRLLLLTQQVSRREDDLSRPYRGLELAPFPSPSPVSFRLLPSTTAPPSRRTKHGPRFQSSNLQNQDDV